MLRKAYVGLIAVLAWTALLAIGCGMDQNAGKPRAKALFDTCQPCHGANGAGNPAVHAPPIAGLPEWYIVAQLQKFKGNMRGAHPDDMEGHRMRPIARTLYRPGDLEAVAGYVAAMKPVGTPRTLQVGDAKLGEANYTSICVTCHGPDGRGNVDMGSPPLTHQADWYMVSQLHKFRNGMRGAHPDDVTGAQMAAMSSTLADSAAVYDVVAYIKSLPH